MNIKDQINSLYLNDQKEMLTARSNLGGLSDEILSHFTEVEQRIRQAESILKHALDMDHDDFYKLGIILVHGEYNATYLSLAVFCFRQAHLLGNKRALEMAANAEDRIRSLLGLPSLYGTFKQKVGDKYHIDGVNTPDALTQLNTRRASYGLPEYSNEDIILD